MEAARSKEPAEAQRKLNENPTREKMQLKQEVILATQHCASRQAGSV
jgi:hypothetical protein